MVSMNLVVFSCSQCNGQILAVKGDEVNCPHCGHHVKKSYSNAFGKNFIIAIGGEKGLIVAPVKLKRQLFAERIESEYRYFSGILGLQFNKIEFELELITIVLDMLSSMTLNCGYLNFQ